MITWNGRNIFESKCTAIIHGCNAVGAFNAGLAKQIRQKYPKAYSDYISQIKLWDIESFPLVNRLGWVIPSTQPDGRIILNAIIQVHYGTDRVQLNYDALNECLEYCAKQDYTIAFPKIGCGLAGGDWDIVREMIMKSQTQGEIFE
jgi:O-acetyl-ADP-ribose deacetylase (regulator of RNase III)